MCELAKTRALLTLLTASTHAAGEEILELLLAAKNVNVNAADDDGATPLHYACLKSNYKAVRKLLIAQKINLEVFLEPSYFFGAWFFKIFLFFFF